MNFDKVPESNDEPPPPPKRGRWLVAGVAAALVVAGGLFFWQWVGTPGNVTPPPAGQKQLQAKIAYLEERLRIISDQLARPGTVATAGSERRLIEEAVEKQNELMRLRPVSRPGDESRLAEWQVRLGDFNARDWSRQSQELEAAAGALFKQKDIPAGMGKLRESLRLQREINVSPANPALKDVAREARLEQETERLEAEPLRQQAVQLVTQARESVQAGRWTEALQLFGRARDIQLRLNRDYARTRYSDALAVDHLDAEMAALSANDAHEQLEQLLQQAAVATAAQQTGEADRLLMTAAGRQKIINEQFPKSRFVSMERLELIEVERQTVRARAALDAVRELDRNATLHLQRRELFQSQQLVGQALEKLESTLAQLPKARGVDETLRQRLSYLNLRQADEVEIQDETYDRLLPLPGHAQIALLKTEVPQDLFARVMNFNPSRNPGRGLPVDSVAYGEAEEFCRRLGWILGRKVRLPTAAEFRAAVGDAAATSLNAWGIENTPGKSQPVGEKAANAQGFHDLLGNVAEWLAADDGDKALLAGGSFTESRAQLRAQPLRPALKTERARTNGLRVVVEVDLTALAER